MSNVSSGPLGNLFTALKAGEIDRRTFVQRASAFGLSAGMLAFLADTGQRAAAQEGATPEASPAMGGADRPAVGTENQERGAGGALNLIQWQPATTLSPHVATGVKDSLAALPALEPLMHYSADAQLVPILVSEIPSMENGGLNDDLTSVTFRLLPDVVWSDGEPLTAEDVKFTIEWAKDPANAATTQGNYETVDSVEVVDDLTVVVNYSATNPVWMDGFTNARVIYPKHLLEEEGGHDAFLTAPIGTGPYKIDSFSPNDQVTFSINESYREPNKPFFSTVTIKGGGDAAAAARAVLQTGEYDFAWNLQVEPDVLDDMTADEDGPGVLVPFPGVNIERINYNFSDPNTEVDGERSHKDTPHPFLTDPAVREAMNMAVDREQIATEFYGLGQIHAVNLIYGDPAVESENTSWEHNPERAAEILDEAGWVLNDNGVREKDGVEMRVVFATSVNSVRQRTQAVTKQALENIGIMVQLEQIDAGVYFDGSAGNDQNINHFYWDMCMYQSVPQSTRPMTFVENWYAGEDDQNIAQESNGWQGINNSRYKSEEFDALYEQALTEADPDTLADLFIQMNDHIVMNNVVNPLVVVGSPRGSSRRLRQENLAMAAFSYDYWNIANWNLADDAEG
jgi:peptide/nickel transport system substrate-binding protein